MEHENAKFLNAKRELSDENVSSYEKQRKSYEQLHHNVSLYRGAGQMNHIVW